MAGEKGLRLAVEDGKDVAPLVGRGYRSKQKHDAAADAADQLLDEGADIAHEVGDVGDEDDIARTSGQ